MAWVEAEQEWARVAGGDRAQERQAGVCSRTRTVQRERRLPKRPTDGRDSGRLGWGPDFQKL